MEDVTARALCGIMEKALIAEGVSPDMARILSERACQPVVKTGVKTAKRVVKKKTSAWARYLKKEMPKLRKKYPRTSPQDLMKKASRSWKKSTMNPNRKRR